MIQLILLIAALSPITSYGYLIQPKIINGLRSNPENYPFFVNVRVYDGYYTDTCGGALLNDR